MTRPAAPDPRGIVSDDASVEVARAVISAWGDREALLALLADDALITPTLVIDEGTLRGTDEVRRWLEAIDASYDEYRVAATGYERGANDRVLVCGSIAARPKGVQREHVREVFWVITVEGSRVTSAVSHPDEAAARRAAGLPA